MAAVQAPGGELDAAVLLEGAPDDQGRLQLRALSPRGNDRAVLAATGPEAARRLAGALAGTLARSTDRWVLSLGPVPVGDVFLDELARRLPYAVVETAEAIPLVEPPPASHSCSDPSDCSNLSVNMRRNLRKGINRLGTDGRACDVRFVRSLTELDRWLDPIWQLRCRRDEFVGRSYSDPSGRTELFWRHSLRIHAALDELELGLLEIDGELAAYVLALDDRTAYRVLEGRFDSHLARYSPGKLLEADVVRRSACLAGRPVDWMNGVAPHKLVAATAVQRTRWLHAARCEEDLPSPAEPRR